MRSHTMLRAVVRRKRCVESERNGYLERHEGARGRRVGVIESCSLSMASKLFIEPEGVLVTADAGQEENRQYRWSYQARYWTQAT